MEEATARNQIEHNLAVTEGLESGNEYSEEWKVWRQAIRDVPEQTGFPDNIVWPEPPDNMLKAAAEGE